MATESPKMNCSRKKLAIGRTPHLVTVQDNSCSCDKDDALISVGFTNTLERPNSDPEVKDSNVQTDSHTDSHIAPTFVSEGFCPTDFNQQDEEEENSKVDAEIGGNVSPFTSFAIGGKRNPYALSIRDLNPIMHAFLSSVKKYFTQKINLEKQKAALCVTTYNKAQESILGMYTSLRLTFTEFLLRGRARVIAVNWGIGGCKCFLLKACFGQCFLG